MSEKRFLLILVVIGVLVLDCLYVVPAANEWFRGFMTPGRINEELELQAERHPGSPAAAVGEVQIYIFLVFLLMHAITSGPVLALTVWFVCRQWRR